MRSPSNRIAALVALLIVTAACAGGDPSAVQTPTFSPLPTIPPDPTPTPAPTPTATPTGDECRYAEPDPDRPVLTLDLDVQGRKVVGREQLKFTPDLPITEVVLRLWAAGPRVRKAGGSTSLLSVRVDGRARPFTRTSQTMVRIPWKGAKDKPLTLELAFEVTLAVGADDRLGSRGQTSWLGSAFPLLAWERGRGWATEPATSAFAEASTSEAMELARLSVKHAPGLSVIATGEVVSENAGRTVTRAGAVRDVAVAVGRFKLAEVDGPVPVLVGVDPSLADDPDVVAAELARSLRSHAERFGPYPFGRLAAAVVPDLRGGIEYPGAILLGKGQVRSAVPSHEVAHQWFYGLVGDNQGRDPWLDEAFATYAEAIDRNSAGSYRAVTVPAEGRARVGRPMTFWEQHQSAYYRAVYLQGAVALLNARRADPDAFDAQVRCFVAATAYRIARPDDVERLVPLAVPALRRVGALTG